MSYEILFLSEINEQKLSPGQRIRTIGIIEMEPFSFISGQMKWKDISLRIDLEYVQSVRVTGSTFYQALGEIQRDDSVRNLCPPPPLSFLFHSSLFSLERVLPQSEIVDQLRGDRSSSF